MKLIARKLLFFVLTLHLCDAKKIGLLTVATGKYINFISPLIESAKKFFCKNHEVYFFVFTDQSVAPVENVIILHHKKLGWPYDTMMRVQAYNKYKVLYGAFDYLFACDADMLFVNEVGDEILSTRVGTRHPGFFHKRGSYEVRKSSAAYVPAQEGEYYFAGGFYGGKRDVFIDINRSILEMIERDKKKNLIAVWHDESYLNRYFIDHPPTKILAPDYCFPDQPILARKWGINYFKPKLLALTKKHSEYQK